MKNETFLSGISISPHLSSSSNKVLGRVDLESIDAQLDRLNFTLADLLKPEEKDFGDSFSFQGSEVFMDNDQDIIEKVGDIALKYDRSLMALEDFYAHEVRKESSRENVIRSSCMLSDLYEIKAEVGRTIELVENGVMEQSLLNVGSVQVLMDIKKNKKFTVKEVICNGFMGNKTEHAESAYVKQLENEVEELSYRIFHSDPLLDLEKHMFEAFTESVTGNFVNKALDITPYSTSSSLVVGELNNLSTKHCKNIRESLIKELEWESTQCSILKLAYETKLKSLEEKENQFKRNINDFQLEIYKKLKILESEKNQIRMDKENLCKSEIQMRNKILNIRDEIKTIKELLVFEENFDSPLITPCLSPRRKDSSEFNISTSLDPNDTSKIQEEIHDLELELESSSDKNPITFKINRLRNKISMLKSEKALNSSANIKRKSSFLTYLQNNTNQSFSKGNTSFQLNLSIDLPPQLESTPKSTTRAYTCYTARNTENSCDYSPQPTRRATCQVLDGIEKDENLIKMLEMKESRLRKKEEELIRKENALHNSWMKLPNANELIPMVQKEIISYRDKADRISKIQGELDVQARENIENRKRLKNIEATRVGLNKQLEEKIRFAEMLDDICARFEEISVN